MGEQKPSGMRELALLTLLLLAVSAAPKGKGSAERSSEVVESGEIIPLSNQDVVLLCTAGTPLQEKFSKAYSECSDERDRIALEMRGGRKGKQGKGKGKQGKGKQGKGKGKGGKATSGKGGKKCLAVTEIIRKLEVRSKKDKCIFNNLGWVETNGIVAEEVMVNEVKSLPE